MELNVLSPPTEGTHLDTSTQRQIRTFSVTARQTRVMRKAEAEWDNAESLRSHRTVIGAADAARLCVEIEADGLDHVLVSFTSPAGAFFAIGLGAPDSCALFWQSAEPPYVQSHGHQPPDRGPVAYWYGGNPAGCQRASESREVMRSGRWKSSCAGVRGPRA